MVDKEMEFEEMMASFIGREIEQVEIDAVRQEILIVLNDNSAMVVGCEDSHLYLKRLTRTGAN